MQKSIQAIAATAVMSFLLSGTLQAQNGHNSNVEKTVYRSIPAMDNTSSAPLAQEDLAVNNPIIQAKFSTSFPLATSAQWANAKDDLWVSFLNNGRKANACFTPKGKMKYVILDLASEQLPPIFSNTIKKDYPLYSVYSALEIKAFDAVAYQVVLENSANFITLKYTSEGVEEIQQVKKSAD